MGNYKTIVALSQRTLTISSGTAVFEYGGTPHSTATDLTYTAAEWMEYINTTASFTSAHYEDDYEFCYFVSSSTLKVVHSDLAAMIGFPYNALRSAGVISGLGLVISGTFWGNARLVLQGSAHTSNSKESYMKKMPIQGVPMQTTTKILVGFGVIDNYDKDNDFSGYKAEVLQLDEAKKQWVKDFIHEGKTNGQRDLCNVYGEFRLNGSAVQVNPTDYSQPKTDNSPYKTVGFNIGFIDQVIPSDAVIWLDGSTVTWLDGSFAEWL